MDSLELVAAHRPGWRSGSTYSTERHWLDFELNGARLSTLLRVGDKVSVLGWLHPRQQRVFVDALLLRSASSRVTLYVCPECADDSCGVVSVDVARQGESVVWRDFHHDAVTRISARIDAPTFTFDWETYRATIIAQRG